MEKWKIFCSKRWYLLLVEILLFIQAAVFLCFRENSFIAVHDNMDLFVAHLQILKNNHAFFAHNVTLPMVGGVSRDTFGSEFSLYNILYFLLPNFTAYMLGYALKILIGFFSFLLLAKDIYQEKYKTYEPILCILALSFGLIPVFPAYGIAFTSVPLLIYLLRRIYREPKLWLFVALFAYPLVSYFSYFGFFLLAYMVCAVIILWIRDKRFPKTIFLSVILLSAGYVCFEYRLFKEMLFGSTITIRTTMVNADFTFTQVLQSIMSVFVNTIFHAQDSHMYVVLPVCVAGIIAVNIGYLKKKAFRAMRLDSINLTFLLILFNCVVYGIYDSKAVRTLFETLLPPLTGFQFNRTIFFNPLLWYALLFLVLKRLYDKKIYKWKRFANVVAVLAVLIVMFEPQVYNDFYNTCYNQAYQLIKKHKSSTLNYQEFYSKELFDEIKEDIDYQGEWAVAYGMHPAVLEYNGISTLDGYLGLYSQEYKERFRKVIAPALDQSEEFRTYFDDWGARAYLYSGAGENTYEAKRDFSLEDSNLYIDSKALGELGGKYIFSRISISNDKSLALSLKGTYSNTKSPYVIYVYEVQPGID